MWAIAEWLGWIPKNERAGASSVAPTAADIAAPGTNPAYVAKAIRAELDELAGTPEGARNDTLAKVAVAVFEFVKGGHADKAAAYAELERIALAIGLGPSEIDSTLRHNWKKAKPRTVPPPRAHIHVVEATGAQLPPRNTT
jgi:hypothetical protein